MVYSSFSGQSAIEYLMTYGWMLLVVAIVGGTIFSVAQSESVDTVSGMEGENVYINDFGVTSEDELGMDIQNRGSNTIVVSEVNVTDPETGEWVYKEFTGDSQVGVASDKIFQIPNVTRTDGANTLNVEIIYNSGGLKNLSATGTITGNLQLTESRVSYEGNPEDSEPANGEENGDFETILVTYERSQAESGGNAEDVNFDRHEYMTPDGDDPENQTLDISDVNEVEIVELHGAGGESINTAGGRGGTVENVVADISQNDRLYIWVGDQEWGRYIPTPLTGSRGEGGKSTEISVFNTNDEDSDTEPFIAAAGGGQGGDGEDGVGNPATGLSGVRTGGGGGGTKPPAGGGGSELGDPGNPGEGAVEGHGSPVPIISEGSTVEGGGAEPDEPGYIILELN